jgi:hypothetical protein
VQVEWFEEGIRICRLRTKPDFGVPTSSKIDSELFLPRIYNAIESFEDISQ